MKLGQMMLALSLAVLPLSSVAAKDKDDFPKTLPGGWVYAWGDEFNGNKLDLKKWKYELGVIRNRGASQTYTKDCVKVQGGMLKLYSRYGKTRNSNYKPGSDKWTEQIEFQPFSSGSVTTRDVKHFTMPGRLEFRAKVPKARGVWPAIWTLHKNQYGWPANGEIDILEHISQEPNKCYCIFRWGRNGTNQEEKVIRTKNIPNYSEDFHVYVLEWDENIMRILIDDEEIGRINMSQADYPNGDNPLKTPCYLILNTALGGQGTWPQKAVPEDYPVCFEIDYARYYTKGENLKAHQEEADEDDKPDKKKGKQKKKKNKKKKKSSKKD